MCACNCRTKGPEVIAQDEGIFPKSDSGGSCGSKPNTCSGDLHSIVDCNGAVV